VTIGRFALTRTVPARGVEPDLERAISALLRGATRTTLRLDPELFTSRTWASATALFVLESVTSTCATLAGRGKKCQATLAAA
jgi:hypothetical protein